MKWDPLDSGKDIAMAETKTSAKHKKVNMHRRRRAARAIVKGLKIAPFAPTTFVEDARCVSAQLGDVPWRGIFFRSRLPNGPVWTMGRGFARPPKLNLKRLARGATQIRPDT